MPSSPTDDALRRLAELPPWVAVVNHGRWIAECPNCPSAQLLKPDQPSAMCTGEGGCGYMGLVVWPKRAAEITTILAERPREADRNWAPAGHRQTHVSLTPAGRTVAAVFPHGQSPDDLRAENREIAVQLPPALSKEELVVKANAVLAELGFAYDPDTDSMRRL